MNGRVGELRVAAWEQVNKLNPDSRERDTWFIKFYTELIIEECAEICLKENVSSINIDDFNSGKFTIQDLATRSCGENLANIIKKRFGVK